MGTKLNPGKYDCYHKAKPDEPMFTLLARDPDAPMLVELWARIKLRVGEGTTEKLGEAVQCAEAMREWQQRQLVADDNETHDRPLCDCFNCENWRAAQAWSKP